MKLVICMQIFLNKPGEKEKVRKKYLYVTRWGHWSLFLKLTLTFHDPFFLSNGRLS